MDLIVIINAMCCAAMSAACGWLIMTRRVDEGPLIKLGLGLVTLAMGGLAALMPRLVDAPHAVPVLWAMLLGNAGLAIVVAGVAWRLVRSPAALEVVKAVSGWTPLAE